MTFIMYILRLISGADPGFQVRGGELKKIAPSGGRREKIWGISCEKSRFYAKKLYLFQFYGEGGGGGGGAITGRNFGINLKEVIDSFIWTIELCHICNFFKHFFNRTLFLTTTNVMIYSSTFLRTTITNL